MSIAQDGSPGESVGQHDAHTAPGILHQAVSVQLVDQHGRWLLQRRAASKALFASHWSNTCCTHPKPGEVAATAAARRVYEELGLIIRNLASAGVFTYRAVDPRSGLVEYEQDHVYAAFADTAAAVANPDEISQLVSLSFTDAASLVASEAGTPWAAEVLRRVSTVLQDQPVLEASTESPVRQVRDW